MDKDFSQYQKIIEKFRGVVGRPDFDTQFNSATTRIPKSDRFLLKMELKRLASPCARLIDLRGNVDGECKPFEHNDRVHYLDDIAVSVFRENIDAYGSYTFGVYEACQNTKNNFRVIYQQEKEQLTQAPDKDPAASIDKVHYPAKFHKFGQYFDRCEERMNFAVALKVTLAEKSNVDATSIDLSVSGCKIRFNETQRLAVGDKVKISFIGLTQEFNFGDDNLFTYQIRNLLLEDKIQIVGLERIVDGEVDGFGQFLKGYIQGNKRRYKVNLDNTISALYARSFEQFSLPKTFELPIFMSCKDGQFFPRYAHTTDNNQDTCQYWQDEARRSTLHNLVNNERMSRMITAAKLGRSLIVYSFIHKSQGKHYFYTADDKQLAEDKNLRTQFIAFAAQKDSFRVTELTLLPIDKNKIEVPFTIAGQLPSNLAYLDLPIPEEELAKINDLKSVVVATNITNKYIDAEYALLDATNVSGASIKAFGHKRTLTGKDLIYIGINYKNQRAEPRFIYKTPAKVEVEGVVWQGKSVDFSVSGLQVVLEKSAVLRKGEIVYITFPKLQQITSQFELKALPYEIMRINKEKTVLNLRVHVQQHQHIGRTFFKALIDKNRGKLTPDEYSMMSPLLAKGLRNIYAAATNTPSLFVQTSGTRYKIESIGAGRASKFIDELNSLSERVHYHNLYPLLCHEELMKQLKPALKTLQLEDKPLTQVIFIAIKDDVESIEKSVTVKIASELISHKAKQMFISNALKKGRFYCIMTKLSRTKEPDIDYLSPELSYISSYAIHRGKQIEQDIWSTVGLVQLFDVTQETILRCQLLKDVHVM